MSQIKELKDVPAGEVVQVLNDATHGITIFYLVGRGKCLVDIKTGNILHVHETLQVNVIPNARLKIPKEEIIYASS